MTLTEAQLRKLDADLAIVERVRAEYPIASWTAWDSKESSQRRACIELGEDVTCIFGGNRSGKTELNRALAVAYALGRDHPAVIVWATANGFDLSLIPTGPGRCWLVALSSGDSVRYHRKQVDKLLPTGGKRWYNRNGKGEARVEISVPGYDEVAEIYFKACDQGEGGMQGDECRYIGFDEEPPYAVFEEASMRGGNEPLRMVISMTPLKGLTWVFERFVEPHPPGAGDWKTTPTEGVRCHWLDFLDNPNIDATFRKQQIRKLSKMSPEKRAARQKGLFTSFAGRIYAAWSRDVHLVALYEIPPEWPRFRALDFGFTHPSVCLWIAIGPDGQFVIYRCLYEPGLTTRELAAKILALEAGEEIEMSWADPSRPESIRELRVEYDLHFWPGHRPKEDGIDECTSLLMGEPVVNDAGEITSYGPPALQVFDSPDTRPFVLEIEKYVRRPSTNAKRDAPETPWDKDDHAMDAWRYGAMGVRHYR